MAELSADRRHNFYRFRLRHPVLVDTLIAVVLVIGALLLAEARGCAQDLPIIVHHPIVTEDREFRAEAAAMWVAWGADTVTTHLALKSSPYVEELGQFGYASRSTWASAGPWAAVDGGSMLLAYEWKRHVRNRFLHQLWRAPMAWRIDGHAAGAVQNYHVIGRASSYGPAVSMDVTRLFSR